MLGKLSNRIYGNHPRAHAFTGAKPGPGSAAAFACPAESGPAESGADSRTALAYAAESCADADAGTDTEPAADGVSIPPG